MALVINGSTGLTFPDNSLQGSSAILSGLFNKDNKAIVAFTKTGNGTATTATRMIVEINNVLYTYASGSSVIMPTLTAGTDYAIYACTDGTIRADVSFSAPTGYTTLTSKNIGGFHYAPGGHSGSPGGGNATPQINEYSFWDLKFRPASSDPRGRALVAGKFWAAIYLVGVDHITNGISKYNVTMADGSSPPKIPTQFGGTGSNAYTTMNWWEAGEVCTSHGMRLPTYMEFSALAYGVTENSSIGADQNSTVWNSAYVSKWGINQASGVLWQWGDEFVVNADTTAWNWYSQTGGRGNMYERGNNYITAVLFGGDWHEASNSGSRCSHWNSAPSNSSNFVGARAVCDHLILV